MKPIISNNNKIPSYRIINSLTNKKTRLLDLGNPKGLLSFLNRFMMRIILIIFDSRKKAVLHTRWIKNFVFFILKMNKNHGASYTIKYMKASLVAIQRALGGQPLSSYRELEPTLSMPRLVGGLPSIISPKLRKTILNGSIPQARLVITMFSLFRILKSPIKPKISTITAPFTGNLSNLQWYCEIAEKYSSIMIPHLDVSELYPTSFYKSSKHSPSSRLAWASGIKDLICWSNKPVYHLSNYLIFVGAPLLGTLIHETSAKIKGYTLARDSIGALAFKEEAAGKLRVFALVDSWTQMSLKPLHNSLMRLLRSLPNDGTFDQTMSVNRCIEKMKKAKCAYSYDLSAATDRLPIDLQAAILNCYLPGLGDLWKPLLIDRDFVIPFNKYGIPEGPIRYAVGQPMGALSSWAMLALTHHIIIQMAYRQFWNIPFSKKGVYFDQYEVLGDDVVIFDKDVATTYLSIMDTLGVEINLSKSLISDSGTALEFAKRTIFRGEDVSPLPWKLLLSADSTLAGRISLFYHIVRDKSWTVGMNRLFGCLFQSPDLNLGINQKEMYLKTERLMRSVLRGLSPSVGLFALIDVFSTYSRGANQKPLMQFPAKALFSIIANTNYLASYCETVKKSFQKANIVFDLIQAPLEKDFNKYLDKFSRPREVKNFSQLYYKVSEWSKYQIEVPSMLVPNMDFRVDQKSDSIWADLVGHAPAGGVTDSVMDVSSYRDYTTTLSGSFSENPLDHLIWERKKVSADFQQLSFFDTTVDDRKEVISLLSRNSPEYRALCFALKSHIPRYDGNIMSKSMAAFLNARGSTAIIRTFAPLQDRRVTTLYPPNGIEF